MAPEISVVICTYNRATVLPRVLCGLSEQTIDLDRLEIVIVDNGSTDPTRQIAESFKQRFPRYIYHFEKEPGLSIARNRGWKLASAPVVAFLDDDAIPAPDWAECILKAFDEIHPSLDCLGGKIDPEWDCTPPHWLTEELYCYYSILDFSEKRIIDQNPDIAYGANIAFSRRALESTGGFDPRWGRRGNYLFSGEERDLITRITAQGGTCAYDPAVRVSHVILGERLKKQWILRRIYMQGFETAHESRESVYSRWVRTKGIIRTFLRVFFSLKHLRYLLRPSGDQHNFNEVCNTFRKLGFISGALGFHLFGFLLPSESK